MSVKAIFDKALLGIIAETQANMVAQDAVATGKSYRSLSHEAFETRGLIYGAKSFLFIEKGRKPGKKPPFAPIKEWVEARGLGGTNPDGFAWALVHAIGQRGVGSLRSDKQQSPRDIFTSVITKARIERIISEINQFKVTEVQSEIVSAFRGPGVQIV